MARGAAYFEVTMGTDEWLVTQIIADPADHREWRLKVRVDLATSRAADRPALDLLAIERL